MEADAKVLEPDGCLQLRAVKGEACRRSSLLCRHLDPLPAKQHELGFGEVDGEAPLVSVLLPLQRGR